MWRILRAQQRERMQITTCQNGKEQYIDQLWSLGEGIDRNLVDTIQNKATDEALW